MATGKTSVYLVTLVNRIGLIVFTVILTIGQLVFAIGGLNESWSTMMAGRLIFGLGGENMTVG